MARNYRHSHVRESKREMWAGECFQEQETLKLDLKYNWDFG